MGSILREPLLPVYNTSTALIATNAVLLSGQVAIETDTNRSKRGNGVSTYTQLAYSNDGTYTPTFTSVTNIDSSTVIADFLYVVTNSIVVVSGILQIDFTASATFSELGVSIPIASDFSGSGQACGTCVCQQVHSALCITSDAANNRARIQGVPQHNNNQQYSIIFQYRII